MKEVINLLRDFINIVGIADPLDFPVISAADRFKQFTAEDLVTLPTAKPDIEQINTVMVEANVDSFRTIATPVGLKVIVDGTITQKIIYTANNPDQPVHSAHFILPYCTFIDLPLILAANQSAMDLLQTLGLTLETALDGPPKIIIEDLSATQVDARRVKKCEILFTWVKVNTLLVPFLMP